MDSFHLIPDYVVLAICRGRGKIPSKTYKNCSSTSMPSILLYKT